MSKGARVRAGRAAKAERKAKFAANYVLPDLSGGDHVHGHKRQMRLILGPKDRVRGDVGIGKRG